MPHFECGESFVNGVLRLAIGYLEHGELGLTGTGPLLELVLSERYFILFIRKNSCFKYQLKYLPVGQHVLGHEDENAVGTRCFTICEHRVH